MVNRGFNWKIICKWAIFHSYVKYPDGIWVVAMKMTTTSVVPGLVHKSDPYDDSYEELGVPNIEVSPNYPKLDCLGIETVSLGFSWPFWEIPKSNGQTGQTYRKIVWNPNFSWLNCEAPNGWWSNPSVFIMGRPLSYFIPSHPCSLRLSWDCRDCRFGVLFW